MNPDCWFVFTPVREYFLIIPEFPTIGKFKSEYPDFAEDYCYFNNTDMPENVSDKEWEQRKKDWNHMINFQTGDKWTFEHKVINASCWTRQGLVAVEKKLDMVNDGDLLTPSLAASFSRCAENMRSSRDKK